jgi:hypothetical protein
MGSCTTENFTSDPNAKLRFSTDTVLFDTVFTTIGTATRRLKVFNPNDDWLRISRIYLEKGDASEFRLNIDGLASWQRSDVEIAPHDSLSIFMQAYIDPLNSNSPLLVSDSIIFETNGNLQNVKLVAWGQDIHFFNADTITTTTWENDKPYVIYSYLLVDSGATLNIKPGTHIYLHKSASIVVYGTLLSEGTIDAPIEFMHDRPEELYDSLPAQWGTIAFVKGSTGNQLQNTYIRNAIAGIQIGEYDNLQTTSITLENCKIQNMSYAGIIAFGATIEASNTLISDCGSFALAAFCGGSYRFIHSTIANYWGGYETSSREYPAVFLSNAFYYSGDDGTVSYYGPLENAYFGNSIISGNMQNEIGFNIDLQGGNFNYQFDHCLLKADPTYDSDLYTNIDTTSDSHFTSILWNQDPLFRNIENWLFMPDSLSPAINKGLFSLGEEVPNDLSGNSRITDEMPDLGAYEFTSSIKKRK